MPAFWAGRLFRCQQRGGKLWFVAALKLDESYRMIRLFSSCTYDTYDYQVQQYIASAQNTELRPLHCLPSIGGLICRMTATDCCRGGNNLFADTDTWHRPQQGRPRHKCRRTLMLLRPVQRYLLLWKTASYVKYGRCIYRIILSKC